jgi:hypothetical protein
VANSGRSTPSANAQVAIPACTAAARAAPLVVPGARTSSEYSDQHSPVLALHVTPVNPAAVRVSPSRGR